jgi:PAS domain S-box-containing protein
VSGDPALFLLDCDGVITGCTAAAQRATGYPAAELRGAPLARLFAEAAAGIDEPLAIAARTGRCSRQGWFGRKDGGRFEAVLTLAPIESDAAGGKQYAATLTEHVPPPRIEAALAQSEQQFRLLVQGVTDYAIYLLDPEGYITNWNAGGERIKGYPAEEIVGQHFSRFYSPEDRARGDPARTLAIASREGRFEGEGWRVRKDGTRFWASAVVDRILDHRGQLIGFAKVTRDMTEKKRAEEALEQARAALAQSQKMEAVGQLTGGVAHDFNNLLTVIANGLDLLAGPIRDEVQKHRIIDSAQRAAERGAKLTEQLLAFSRRQPLRPQIHNINALIGEFEAVLRRACPEPVEVEMMLAPLPPAADIDAPQFETALLNLVVNARDAMPGGGILRLATGIATIDAAQARLMSDLAPGDYVTIAVGDTGEGMSAEVVARACEPFFTTKGVGKGSGLGLSQVYGFVTQSGGYVAIDSKPGAGTTVTLYLPAAEAASADDAAAAAKQASIGRVLVVEDDPEVLDVTVETLHAIGYEVLTAPDGPSALAVLRRDADIDVLFTDIVMPRGMNGVELAREACRLRPQLRVLLASGYPMSYLAPDQAGREEEFAFLRKPYRGAELADKLRALQLS